MEPFQAFERNTQDMLNHLYDPVYRPPESFWTALHLNRESGLQAIRETLLAAIEELKPAAQVPATARAWRIYGMLRYHYVEDLPQELTAERLGITARHLRRNVSEAIHALSLLLWEKYPGRSSASPEWEMEVGFPPTGKPAAPRSSFPHSLPEEPPLPLASTLQAKTSWHEQMARELEALEETAAGAVSNVAEVVHSVLRLATHLTQQRAVHLLAEPVSPQLMASIHPTALRQILIAVVDPLAKQMQGGEIHLSARAEAGEVRICLRCAPISNTAVHGFEPIGELLSSFGITAQVERIEDILQITLTLLQVDRCVLVVDDNPDMAHLYRRYLSGTRYYLQYINSGEKTFEAIDLYHPDLVVLDVMLPDIDGWDLLTRLHENLATRGLPIMICSVMREKELAQALGARYFLTKPVQRQNFIQALDTVLEQG